MKTKEKLKQQHKTILRNVDEIFADFQTEIDTNGASGILGKINQLNELLDEHLRIEDEFLYPLLKSQPQEQVRDIANLFSFELGGFKEVFGKYLNNWNSADLISGSPKEFTSETNAILKTLVKRIQKEDSQLFPLINS